MEDPVSAHWPLGLSGNILAASDYQKLVLERSQTAPARGCERIGVENAHVQSFQAWRCLASLSIQAMTSDSSQPEACAPSLIGGGNSPSLIFL